VEQFYIHSSDFAENAFMVSWMIHFRSVRMQDLAVVNVIGFNCISLLYITCAIRNGHYEQ